MTPSLSQEELKLGAHPLEHLPLLLRPLQLRSLTLRNRIVVSPMCQYRSIDGMPDDWQLVNLGRYCLGGAAVVFGEETAIEPNGRKTYECAGLWNAEHVAAYRRINEFISRHGAIPAIQIGHAGARASCHGLDRGFTPLTSDDPSNAGPAWTCIAPSPNADPGQRWPMLQVPDEEEIRRHTGLWRDAALRAADAGYQVLEIHGAHGYLLHQFLSPVTNRRADAYGGSIENRMRFPLEVADAVRRAWPRNLPLFFRVSAVDGNGGPWEIEDTVAFSRALSQLGVDVVDCSSGGISSSSASPPVPRAPGFQVEHAARVRKDAGIATMAVGLITEPVQAEAILQQGQADLIALARELIWNPNWPVHAAQALAGHTAAAEVLQPDQAQRLLRREAERLRLSAQS